jgi:ketosteroid isomerase-like protein
MIACDQQRALDAFRSRPTVTRRRPQKEKRMTHPNEELVRKGYKAFGEGDMDTLRAIFAPDAVHSAPGSSPVAGEHKGVEDILGFYGQLFERSDGTFKAELQSAKAEGDGTVVANHRGTAQRAGKALGQDDTLTFTISGGKVTQVVEKHSDQAAYDAFWS